MLVIKKNDPREGSIRPTRFINYRSDKLEPLG